MALEISMTGSGTVGNITPGWAANEFGTPVAIGDQSAGTGTVSFAAHANDDSLLVINNDITSTINDLGTVDGVIQSVTQTGTVASVTHGTFLDSFNADVTVSPIETGGPKIWMYELGKALGITNQERPDYSIPSTVFGRIRAFSYCFPFDLVASDLNSVYSFDSLFTNSTRTNNDGDFGFSFTATTQPDWETFQTTDGFPMLPGISTAGNWYNPNPMLPDLWASYEPYFDFMMDVDASTYVRFWIKSGTEESAPTYSNLVRVTIDGSAGTVELINLVDEIPTTIDFNSIENGDPLLFTFWHATSSPFAPPFLVSNSFYGKVTNSSGTATSNAYVDCYLSGVLNFAGDYVNCNKMYYVNIAYVASYSGIYNVPETIDYGYNIDFSQYSGTYYGPYPSAVGVGWELMQQLAAANSFEFAVSGDTLYVRDLALNALDMTNIAPGSTVSPTSTLSGRQINIPYTDAYFVNGVVYDAEADGNNIISVNAGESTITVVKHEVHPISITQPGIVPGSSWPISANEYSVMDSTGYYITDAEWSAYGASVTAIIAPDDPAGIQITVKGPTTEVTLAGGPYRLAVSDGSNDYAALKIGGTGVYSGGNVLNLLTGVDSTKYTRATVNTITNPFICTLEQAYDRGLWAAQKAAGPVVTFSGAIPSRSALNVGSNGGAIVQHKESTYRVTSATISSGTTTFMAERYVTVADMDAIWGSQTVADYDGLWDTYECQDQIIFPYKVA